jgi:large subunit ribosomal protein L17
MKHRVRKKRLGRKTSQRKALIRSLLTGLVTFGKIQTTAARAKVLVSEFDAFVGCVRSQKEKHQQIRQAKAVLYTENAQRILIDEVLPNASHESGLTRFTLMGPRNGDGAEIIQVELCSYADL